MIDIHAHILPGVDDGARTFDVSANMIRELWEQGVTKIIATPHYVDETIYMSSKETNLELLLKLRQKLVDEKVGVEVYLGNEIYINEKIGDLIEKGEIATLADSKYILVELPMSGEYPGYKDVLVELMEDGYKVILAHPERYVAIQEDFEIVRELCDAGILLQCNMGSIIGQYGKSAKKTIQKLAKNKMIFAFGSDIHHCHDRRDLLVAQDRLKKYYNDTELAILLVDNPGKILKLI
ncbi:phosphoesterase [Candidatus Saccharibacteria bacterium]|nr:phosphoesterase [Candidatus Saccharibacteria bacterium]